ncbi:MAG: HEAT repeat domain-containing protein, partial [Candidatus Omnitrophota bacterium]|nr:HEAT repeat domain-containing protein [Candidatus Omnitrophota bacterium]
MRDSSVEKGAERFAKLTKLLSQLTNKYTKILIDMDTGFGRLNEIDRSRYISLLASLLDQIPLTATQADVEREFAASGMTSVFGIPIEVSDGNIIINLSILNLGSIDELEAVLSDLAASTSGKVAAVKALGQLETDEAIQALIDVLAAPATDPAVITAAAQALNNISRSEYFLDYDESNTKATIVCSVTRTALTRLAEALDIPVTDPGSVKGILLKSGIMLIRSDLSRDEKKAVYAHDTTHAVFSSIYSNNPALVEAAADSFRTSANGTNFQRLCAEFAANPMAEEMLSIFRMVWGKEANTIPELFRMAAERGYIDLDNYPVYTTDALAKIAAGFGIFAPTAIWEDLYKLPDPVRAVL